MERHKRRIFFKRKRWKGVVAATAIVAAVSVIYAANSRRQVELAHDSLPRCNSDAAHLKVLAALKRTRSISSDIMKIDRLHETESKMQETSRDTRHCVAEVRIGMKERTVRFTMVPGGGEDGFSIRLTGT